MTARQIHIHYQRLPDQVTVYDQVLLLDRTDVKVTFQPDTPIKKALQVDGHAVLEPGSPVVWFTFPGRWHDIGRFHTVDGRFTGLYANILTPPRMQDAGAEDQAWHTTDLFLDVWLPAGGPLTVLDVDQFDEARNRGWVDAELARAALDEVDRIRRDHAAARWPPAIVGEWPLERVRESE